MKSKLIHVTVALWIDPEADVAEVIAEMEYDFTFEDKIRSMEIVDTDTDV
jgi:hypothetical protein